MRSGAGGGSGACPARIWDRLAEVGRQTREALAGLPGWKVADAPDARSAIVALRAANGQDIAGTRARRAGYGRVKSGPKSLAV